MNKCSTLYRRTFIAINIAITITCSLVWASPYRYAQSATATLGGTVEDENGSVISNVEIIVLNPSTAHQRKVITNSEGNFTFSFLPPGRYTVTAKRNGFAPVEIKDVLLNVNDQRMMKIQLRIGEVGETVNVVGASL